MKSDNSLIIRKIKMLAPSNPFYKNPERNAHQLLQQHMAIDVQKKFQESLMDLLMLQSMLSHTQLGLCVPLPNGFPILAQSPINTMNFIMPQGPESYGISTQKEVQKTHLDEHRLTKETKLHVSMKGDHQEKTFTVAQEECRLRDDGVEVVLDLRGVLPAEVTVRLEERSLRVEASRIDKDGYKNYWRQYDLPACIQYEAAKILLGLDGFLRISVPWFTMEQ